MASGFRRCLAAAGIVAALMLGTAPAGLCGDTLYADLGGKATIYRFVGETIDLAVKDPRIAKDFDNSNLVRLRQRVTLFLCQLTGGPCHYPGQQTIAQSHKGLHLMVRDFNAFAEDLQIAMNHAGVPFHTQNRLMALLAPMERDIVTR